MMCGVRSRSRVTESRYLLPSRCSISLYLKLLFCLQKVLPPTADAFITFYDSTNLAFYQHNTKIPDGQPAPSQSNTYVFDVPANTFLPLGTYTITMDTGAVEGVTGCGAGAGVQSASYETAGGSWGFTCKFYVPPPVTTAAPGKVSFFIPVFLTVRDLTAHPVRQELHCLSFNIIHHH